MMWRVRLWVTVKVAKKENLRRGARRGVAVSMGITIGVGAVMTIGIAIGMRDVAMRRGAVRRRNGIAMMNTGAGGAWVAIGIGEWECLSFSIDMLIDLFSPT